MEKIGSSEYEIHEGLFVPMGRAAILLHLYISTPYLLFPLGSSHQLVARLISEQASLCHPL